MRRQSPVLLQVGLSSAASRTAPSSRAASEVSVGDTAESAGLGEVAMAVDAGTGPAAHGGTDLMQVTAETLQLVLLCGPSYYACAWTVQ